MAETSERVLCCAPVSRPDCWTPGSITGKFCSQCKAEVMVALSGQRMLRKYPRMAIICLDCALKDLTQFDACEAAPGAIREAFEFLTKEKS